MNEHTLEITTFMIIVLISMLYYRSFKWSSCKEDNESWFTTYKRLSTEVVELKELVSYLRGQTKLENEKQMLVDNSIARHSRSLRTRK